VFNKKGKLCRNADFHVVNQTEHGKTFQGTYYFGGKNGKLTTKKGWITYKKQKYYIDDTGKMLTNCWKSGYYLQANGTIARSKTLADGTYVGYDGKKCDSANASIDGLRAQLQKMINGYRGSWSVYVKDLKTGATININEKSMYPASTIKAFVMAATYDRIKNGKLSYNSSIRRLLTNMITVSDNESYNTLVRRNSSSGSFTAGAAEINKYLKKNGYTRTGCHSTLHPSSSAHTSDGHRNTASAKDCGVLLENIYLGKCVSKKYSAEMLNLLLRQTRRWKIPAGIPSGVKVANKTGETSTTQHDIAIVYGKKTDYIICVFSSGVSESAGISGIRSISGKVYKYLNS
jgi:beta-lactamase class A